MDHKPLVSLLGKKNLEELSARVHRLGMKLMRYQYEIEDIPGRAGNSRHFVKEPGRTSDTK